jgi:murein DD-endopeptidase MepM/ murein hydrolase activator NlpD
MRKHKSLRAFTGAFIAAIVAAYGIADVETMKARASERDLKGYGITKTGLTPVYPDAFACSPLTSLYASWTDVDGGRRSEKHSGVDGGKLNEPLLAPGDGVVVAAWEGDSGWGDEGALLLLHSRAQLNLPDGAPFYYSAFDHLRFDDVARFASGQRVVRGEVLARVFRPGGKKKYLPEVHWEVWEVEDPGAIAWEENRRGRPDWTNKTAELIDPLYLLSRDTLPDEASQVAVTPFEAGRDYHRFRGFTYILPCERRT